MTRGAIAAALVVGWVGAGSPTQAADLERYGDEGRLGDWIVLCDSEDDMGGTTYFDCVVRSASAPAIVISDLSGGPVLSVDGASGDARLLVADLAFDFDACPAAACRFDGTVSDFVDLVSVHAAVLETGTERADLSAAGIGEAVAHAIGLVD